MISLIRRHHISFKHAWDGIVWALRTQPNFRIHLTLSLAAICGCYWLRIPAVETLFIIMTIIVGLGVEMVNTAIESMTDLISREYSKEAKIAKDVSAGMMLFTAFGALIIAGIVFIPRLILIFGR